MFPLKFRQLFALSFLLLWTLHLHLALACHGELLAAGISEQEKEIILHEHNRLRQQVATGRYPGQPGAKNMKEMIWDNDLAERAQRWAENCQFKHDPQRTLNRFTMGQNLAVIWSTAPLDPGDGDFPSRIQSWFNEVQKYSFGDAWTPKTGHYSQLVWGETNLVGCGFSEYKDARKYNKLYVCNYGPGGNVYGYNPYEAGKPSCSAYGLKSSPRYQGLCMAESADYSDNAIETYEYQTTNLFNVPPLSNTQATPYITNTNTYYRPNAFVFNNYPKKTLSTSSFHNQQAIQPVYISASPTTSQSLSSVVNSQIQSQSQAQGQSQPQSQSQSQSQNQLQLQQQTAVATKKGSGSTGSAIESFYATNVNNGQYKRQWNTFENYRPASTAELSKAVYQQTASHITSATTTLLDQQKQQQQQQQQQQYYHLWSPSTISPRQSAWSLYSWRG